MARAVRLAAVSIACCVLLSAMAIAQNGAARNPPNEPPPQYAAQSAPAASQPAASEPASKPADEPAKYRSPFELNYSGDLLTRPRFTGDWGGLRNELSAKGINFDVEVVQYVMGNAYGGKNTAGAIDYSGTVDFSLMFDLYAMGLWPGAFIKVRGETKFGSNIEQDVGAISPPNFDALLPYFGGSGLTTLTEYWYLQYLSKELFVLLGQVDLTGLPGGNVFSGSRYSQFMNTSLWYPMTAMGSVPYAAMTAGVGWNPTDWLSLSTLVIDSNGAPSYSGFETAFHGKTGVTILQNATFHIKPFGLPGNQRFTFTGTTRKQIQVGQMGQALASDLITPNFDSRLGLATVAIPGGRTFLGRLFRRTIGRAIAPEPSAGNWSFWYNFDQFLYVKPDDPNQGFGVFGNFGYAPGAYWPVTGFYSFGVGGKGLIPTRPKDQYGVGYYYVNMSNDFPWFIKTNAEQGVELYYNIEVTPWLHITPDLQIIVNPGGDTSPGGPNPAIVYGLRMQMSF